MRVLIECQINDKEVFDALKKYHSLCMYFYSENGYISKLIFKVLDTTKETISSRSRKKDIAEKRHIYTTLAYLGTKYNTVTIAKWTGRTDHAAVNNSRNVVVNRINFEPRFKEKFLFILNILITVLEESYDEIIEKHK